jgi:hypothetical protein
MPVVAMLAWPSHSCTFGDVGLVIERIGGSYRPQRMGGHSKPTGSSPDFSRDDLPINVSAGFKIKRQ